MGVVIRTYISGLGVVDLPLGHPLLEENAQARLALKEKDDTILGCTVAILYFTIGNYAKKRNSRNAPRRH